MDEIKTKILSWDEISPGVQKALDHCTNQWHTLWSKQGLFKTDLMVPIYTCGIEETLDLILNHVKECKNNGFQELNIILHKSIGDQNKIKRIYNLKAFL